MICSNDPRSDSQQGFPVTWHTTGSAESPRCFYLFMLSAHTDILHPRSEKNTTKVITVCHTFAAKSQSCAYFYTLASGPMADCHAVQPWETDWAMCVPVDWTKPVVKPCFLSFSSFGPVECITTKDKTITARKCTKRHLKVNFIYNGWVQPQAKMNVPDRHPQN